jgi:hypothetical protein
MTDKDFAIGVTTAIPNPASVSKRTPYLIYLKVKPIKRFISLDKPDVQNNCVQVKGLYSDLPEDEIIKKFQDILTTAPKEVILDVMFPLHEISSMRSLIFRAK